MRKSVEESEMEMNLQLIVFSLLIHVSLGVWQRVTVMKGDTLTLSCPITNPHKTSVEWQTPEAQIMFFDKNKAIRDKRYSIIKLSQSEFSVRISNVTFKDGGNYTCSQYSHKALETVVEVTVLGYPKMSVTKHQGKNIIKCSADGNRFPPQISWEFDREPEFHAQGVQIHQENKKYTSTELLHVYPVRTRVTVRCLVRHPALHSRTLQSFVKIGRVAKIPVTTIPPRVSTSQPQGSTEDLSSTSSWASPAKETAWTVNHSRSSTEATDNRTGSTVSSTDSRPNTTESPHSTGSKEIINQTSNTTGGIFVSETTENITLHNTTGGNRTETSNSDPHVGASRNYNLLVLLVTSLIFGLLVVVIFFAIKLRRAHIAWKRENEDSDPSEESSKSKSSQEDKNVQGQRRRGLFSTAFTQYVVEEPARRTSVLNTNAATPPEEARKEQTSSPQTPTPASVKSDIKETSL